MTGVVGLRSDKHIRLVTIHNARFSPLRIARFPFVLGVEPAPRRVMLMGERSAAISASLFGEDGLPESGYDAWLDSLGLDGDGIRIAVTDTGIDDSHPGLIGSVERRFNYSPLPDGWDTEGHGTAVAGVIAGRRLGANDVRDAMGFSLGMGVAPESLLIDMNFTAETADRTRSGVFDHAAAVLDAHRSGASIWNASWGVAQFNGYTEITRLFDERTRDADPDSPGHQPMLFVFAAGNTADDPKSSTQEAKNIITVGEVWTDTPDQVTPVSARGFTSDLRFFPTIVAPGSQVDTTRSRSNIHSLTYCGTRWNLFLQTGFSYGFCYGTSFAAPHVSGAAALIHQWWARDHAGALPSPAMVKAILVNGAQDIGTPDIPNTTEGWGRINLRNVFTQEPMLYRDQALSLHDSGAEATEVIEVATPSEPLKITLVWTDAPAMPGAVVALVNDLDLLVEQLDEDDTVIRSWVGNQFADGWSIDTSIDPTFDRRNNVEGVHLEDPANGRYRIRVIAHSIWGDGVPDNGDPTDQDFALVIRNARTT